MKGYSMLNNKLEIAKTAAKFVVGSGVQTIMSQVIHNNTNPAEGAFDKAATTVGSAALSWMISDHAVDYAENWMNETAESIRKFKSTKDAVQ